MSLLRGGISNSEYGDSFTVINACRQEYLGNLSFRINRRNTECSHQPFWWGVDEDAQSTNSAKSDAVDGSYSDAAPEALEDTVRDGEKDALSEKIEPIMDGDHVVQENSDSSHSKIDCATQTHTAQSTASKVLKKKPFVSYGLGCHGQTAGLKHTFNVRSDGDIYPSAVRAEARRKQRNLGFDDCFNDVPLTSNIRKMCNHVKQASPHTRCHPSTRVHSSNTHLPSTVIQTDRSKFPSPMVFPCDPSASAQNVVSQQESQAHNQRACMQRPSNINIAPRTSGFYSSNNGWLSEYGRNYPMYPSDIYIRSASQAVSCCRPFTCPSNLSKQFRNRLQSILPSNPVLLSSRGCADGGGRSARRNSSGHYSVGSFITPEGKRISQIQSVR